MLHKTSFIPETWSNTFGSRCILNSSSMRPITQCLPGFQGPEYGEGSINSILMGYIDYSRLLCYTFMLTKTDSLLPLIESKLEYPARPRV